MIPRSGRFSACRFGGHPGLLVQHSPSTGTGPVTVMMSCGIPMLYHEIRDDLVSDNPRLDSSDDRTPVSGRRLGRGPAVRVADGSSVHDHHGGRPARRGPGRCHILLQEARPGPDEARFRRVHGRGQRRRPRGPHGGGRPRAVPCAWRAEVRHRVDLRGCTVIRRCRRLQAGLPEAEGIRHGGR